MQSRGLLYQPGFISPFEKQKLLAEISALRPIWEHRFSVHNPPPSGQENRRLLRPVYWLGNWQFACLNYYHPPKGTEFRCVQAENFPPAMDQMVQRIQDLVQQNIESRDVPRGWTLNTCLVNYYGSQLHGGSKQDVARVGEHKDFEPGPVASVSFGDRALFQFVDSPHKQARSHVILQQWLEDSSLQIFAGEKFKKRLFHRVQRVEKKHPLFDLPTPDFETRRLNLTFRYVPKEHIQEYHRFPLKLRQDIRPYMQQLAQNSTFFREALIKETN